MEGGGFHALYLSLVGFFYFGVFPRTRLSFQVFPLCVSVLWSLAGKGLTS